MPLTSAHLLYLATAAGAEALGLDDGRRPVGRARSSTPCGSGPSDGSTLDVVLTHADDADDALAKVFALGGPADVRGVWVGGDRLR